MSRRSGGTRTARSPLAAEVTHDSTTPALDDDFQAIAGDGIRVWTCSPVTPGFVAIDDGSLVRYFGPT
jgi:hypothetical protein